MKNSIMVNNKTLSEHLKEEDELQLEQEISGFNNDSKKDHFNYRKQRLKIIPKKEKNGKVKMLQNEVNFRNREELARKYLSKDQLKNAMVCWYIGCYKQDKIITRDVAVEFEAIATKYNLKIRFKNIFAAIRNYFGQIKKSSFGIDYVIHKREINQPNYYFLIEKGYNLKPEKAIELSNIYPKKESIIKTEKEIISEEKNIVENNWNDFKEVKNENLLRDKVFSNIEELSKKGLTINIFGNITIDFK